MNGLVIYADGYRRMSTTYICVTCFFTQGIDYMTQTLGVTTLCPTTLSWIMGHRLDHDSLEDFQRLRPNADQLTYRSSTPPELVTHLPTL